MLGLGWGPPRCFLPLNAHSVWVPDSAGSFLLKTILFLSWPGLGAKPQALPVWASASWVELACHPQTRRGGRGSGWTCVIPCDLWRPALGEGLY